MKKFTLLIGLIFLLGISFVSAETCEDSDGGINIYKRGIIEGISLWNENFHSEVDVCQNNLFIDEYYCGDDGLIRVQRIECLSGCQDGACIGEIMQPLSCVSYDEITGSLLNCDVCDCKFSIHQYSGSYDVCNGDCTATNNTNCTCAIFDGENYLPVERQYVTKYVAPKSPRCLDSDGGKNYYGNGIVSGIDHTGVFRELSDYCFDKNTLHEHYCDTLDYANEENYVCPRGCAFGVCLPEPSCIDSDSGLNYSIKGITTGIDIEKYPEPDGTWQLIQGEDSCEKDTLIEWVCKDDYGIMGIPIKCLNGCEKGVCLDIEIVTGGEENIYTEILGNDGKMDYICSGCELDNKCYPFGYRKSENYCSDNYEFLEQLDKEMSCENNFECKSNVCVSGECISEGLIKKILNWFRSIF
ncbi:MAG: hypothetical protein KJ646_02000 [Nanoarchaeota archaeon]|nr:hypothetical protein [Nanoarchaeota archaeon]MBU4116857.1 hypothetical protein [Nanoarchaeota archaeon]